MPFSCHPEWDHVACGIYATKHTRFTLNDRVFTQPPDLRAIEVCRSVSVRILPSTKRGWGCHFFHYIDPLQQAILIKRSLILYTPKLKSIVRKLRNVLLNG